MFLPHRYSEFRYIEETVVNWVFLGFLFVNVTSQDQTQQ